jgi:hypothetical protein
MLFSCRYIAHHTCFCADARALSYPQMPGNTGLSRKDRKIFEDRTAGNPALGN